MPARLSSMELSSPSNPDVDTTTKPSRRKSGRVVKAPEVLGAKRKRVEVTDVEDNSQDDIDDSEGEPDEEELREKKRQTKRTNTGKAAPKRTKIGGLSSQLAIRPAPRAKAKTARKVTKSRPSAVEDSVGLYADIFASDNLINDTVGEWLKRFDQHEANALTELVNFVLRCTGCTLQVDVFDIEDPDNCSARLTEIQDEFQTQDIVEYPLINKNKTSATSFRKTLSGFFNALVHGVATSGILYKSPELMENIQSWVGSMSSAASRPFRHTATVISISIISALSEVGRDLVNARAKNLRQAEGELKKKNKTNQARIANLRNQAEASAERRVKVDDFIKDWFDTVFVHRYRDVDPRIRLDCMTCLGDWLMTYPDHFLDGAHLRYLGWVLSDVVGATRLEVVKQLHRIFKDDDKIAGVRVFTERFRPRMVEMAVRDADPTVRAAVVELLDTLREAGMLEPNDIDSVGQLIYDTENRVRKAVVPFFVASIEEILSSKIEELGGQEVLDETWHAAADDANFESPRMEWLKFKCLAELLNSFDNGKDASSDVVHGLGSLHQTVSSNHNSRFTVAALSLVSKLPELKRWETLAGYLLFDHSITATHRNTDDDVDSMFRRQCKLESKEEVILLDVLNTSVKQCLTDIVEEGHLQKKNKKSKAEIQVQQEGREAAAQRLTVVIPKLLKKFGATPDAASAVLRLEHVLNLNVFQELRQDSTNYTALLDDINKQFMSHENHNVLHEASNALQHARSFEQLGDITESKVHALWEDVVQSLVELSQRQVMSVRGGTGSVMLAEISSTVLRISHLGRISDCTEILETPRQSMSSEQQQSRKPSITPVSILIDLLGRGKTGAHHNNTTTDIAEDTLVSTVMNCLVFYFMWRIISLRTSIMSGKTLNEADVTSLVERRNSVAAQLDTIITQRSGVDGLRIEAAGVMLDLHSMFINVEQLVKSARVTEPPSLVELTAAQLSSRHQLVILRVFSALEADFAKKSRRKLEELSPDDEPEDLSDEDSESDVDQGPSDQTDTENDEAARRREIRAIRKERDELLSEEKLCMLAAKFVVAIRGGVVDNGEASGLVRERLGRNRTRLGHNFKEIIAALDKKPAKEASSKGKKPAAARSESGNPKRPEARKRAAVVASESSEDEDDEVEDGDEEEGLRARGLVEDELDEVQGDDTAEEPNGLTGDAPEADVESLLGD